MGEDMPSETPTATDLLLQTNDLCVDFAASRTVRAVDGVSLDIHTGEIVGLVGETGSGKTVFSLSLLRLIRRPGKIRKGSLIWRGRNLLELGEENMRRLRGSEIAMIFQEPQASLNPVRPVGAQISAVIQLHQKCDQGAARREALRWLEAVRITDPERVYASYPHQCSGGMCQRILIAMALACRPKLLIADEPTTSLDVTIQAQIMDLLLEIRERYGTAILLVSHDLAVIARMCDRIAVMYRGQIVEEAEAKDLYLHPEHPYTRLLLQSVPVPDPSYRPERSGTGADLVGMPILGGRGCRFRDRCPEAIPKCGEQDPVLMIVGERGHQAACIRRQDEGSCETRRNPKGEPELVPPPSPPMNGGARALAQLTEKDLHSSKE